MIHCMHDITALPASLWRKQQEFKTEERQALGASANCTLHGQAADVLLTIATHATKSPVGMVLDACLRAASIPVLASAAPKL